MSVPRRLALAGIVLAAGCAGAGFDDRPPFPPERPAEDLAWPPDRPRVRFLATLGGSADLPHRRSWLRALASLVAGSEGTSFVRPVGIAARAGLLAIADPGVPALFLLDTREQRLRVVRAPGGVPLESPVGVAVATDGRRVFLADSALARVLVLGPRGDVQGRWGEGALARPASVALDDARGRLYVADAQAQRVLALDAATGAVVGERGAWGTGSGEFRWPSFVTVDPAGRLYVVDSLNFRVVVFDSEGAVVGGFGHAGDGSGDFARPKGVALTPAGELCVVDALFDAVQVFDPGGALLLTVGRRGTGPGEFWLPTGAAVDERGRLYVADSYNHRVQAFELVPPPADAARAARGG